ncbi:MAG: glycosyltransferase [Defluviitaleaceae bacterium]|nr:glycosyltransferase [Defluviitaleaceae bacterium]
MKNNPMVSVFVSCYNNTEYLNECLDSILSQTYGNIEIIVSDDGSPNFDSDAILGYIENNKGTNITNVVVRQNECNAGTVKHCNIILDLYKGDYLLFLACDDTFNNVNVVKDLVDCFNTSPPEVMGIVTQVEMRTKDLNTLIEFAVSEDTKRLMNELSPYEFYRKHLVLAPIVFTRIYKREAFEKYGKFDEEYFLIEDYTVSLSHARQGMKTYFLDIVAVNHRDGGISHSKVSKNSRAHKLYTIDLIKVYEYSLKDWLLDAKVQKKIMDNLDWCVRQFSLVWGDDYPDYLLDSYNLATYVSNYWDTIY